MDKLKKTFLGIELKDDEEVSAETLQEMTGGKGEDYE